jgi:MFS family permease
VTGTAPRRGDEAVGAVERKAQRMAHSRRTPAAFYRELLQVGALGWVFILPVLGGVALGMWAHHATGWRGAILVGMAAGILTGAGLVTRRVREVLRRGLDDEAAAASPGPESAQAPTAAPELTPPSESLPEDR